PWRDRLCLGQHRAASSKPRETGHHHLRGAPVRAGLAALAETAAAVSAALGLALAVPASSSASSPAAQSPAAQSPAAQSPAAQSPAAGHQAGTPIKHFIFLMQGGRTFDNYFGTYPGAAGLAPG